MLERSFGKARFGYGFGEASGVEVRFWGTRGSIASPGPETVRYGGNTSCVEVLTDSGTRIVIDCGTGARPLGAAIAAGAAAAGLPPCGSLLISHTHWDHIQGLPFFGPLFQPGARWEVYGPRGLGQSIADTLAGQMNYDYFPVSLEQLSARVDYRDLVEGSFRIGEVTVTTRYLNHPALTLGFRLEADGASVVYLSDHEPSDPGVAGGRDVLASRDDAGHVEFLGGADLVIHDAQYRGCEYPARKGWGHSTIEYAVAAASLGGARRLALFHHDPARTDGDIDRILAGLDPSPSGLIVTAAAEGCCVRLGQPGRRPGPSRPAGEPPAVVGPAAADPARSVLLALPDDGVAQVFREAAEEMQLPVERLPPVWFGRMDPTTVVVIDCDRPDWRDRLAGLQARGAACNPVVLGVTRRRPPSGGDPSVAGWLVWPASPAHVRAKLQAALLGRSCRWQVAPVPEDEERRLEALSRLALLDTVPEERFDRIARLARDRLKLPVARVVLVDRDRQWFKSRIGDDRVQTPRDESVCAHVILEEEVFQVTDLLLDERFADSPVVTGPERARFYAGAPLVMPDGTRVGTLCVVDHRPRVLDAGQLAELRHLARLVSSELVADGWSSADGPVREAGSRHPPSAPRR